ncbi:hypothetical protein GZH46_01874, partial [Fragariocoptes setiger]
LIEYYAPSAIHREPEFLERKLMMLQISSLQLKMANKTTSAINTRAAAKVADQLIARLFDHRQFTAGEIRYLINELEDRCKIGRSLEKALSLNQEAGIVSDMCTDDVAKINLRECGDIESSGK